jgi:hypothetical protein
MPDAATRALALEPLVAYPTLAEVGKDYLLTVDLRWDCAREEWPYPEEEYPVYCRVSAAPLFVSRPVGVPAVVLHRFGGTYGPARFVLTAGQKEMEGAIRITLTSAASAELRVLKLKGVQVQGTPPQGGSAEVDVGLGPAPRQAVPPVMRFLIQVDGEGNVLLSSPGTEPRWRRARRLRRVSDHRGGYFPLPPADELPDTNAPNYELLAGSSSDRLDAVHQRVVRGSPERGDTELFGRYLFDTLLGARFWREVVEFAGPEPACIELALSWSHSELSLHRLSWELLHDGAQFLAARAGPAVAITRLVPGVRVTPRPPDLSRRVLFVVGDALTDPRLRPAARLLGLLRNLRYEGRDEGRGLHVRILEGATGLRVRAALNSFRPGVVCFLTHARAIPPEGRPGLVLQEITDVQDKLELLDAERTAWLLQQGNEPAPVVVLALCGEERLQGVPEVAPLAAELVKAGVPAVVVLSGSLSDAGCRLFARRFGEVLLGGAPLVAATAQGRRAGLRASPPDARPGEWARPGILLNENVSPDAILGGAADREADRRLALWLRGNAGEGAPAFWGRIDFFEAYYDLIRPGKYSVLVVAADEPGGRVGADAPRVGRTRLLRELATQAVRDGHVPCLVTLSPASDPPSEPVELAELLLEAILRTRQLLELPTGSGGQLSLLTRPVEELIRQDGVESDVRRELRGAGRVTVRAVYLAGWHDLQRLASDARARHERIRQAAGRVIVLLDDLERYRPALARKFFEVMCSPAEGPGTVDGPVPVVVAVAWQGAATTTTFQVMTDLVEKSPQVLWKQLRPFEPNGEDLLACEQVLLHPFRLDLGVSGVPVVVNDRAPDQAVAAAEELFRRHLGGWPDRLATPEFYALAQNLLKMGSLTAADDKALLEAEARSRRLPDGLATPT